MIDKIKKYLKELDFSDNEIKIYISLTELGESTSSIIAKKSNLPRTTVIGILEKLEKMKYISTYRHRGKNHYWIESPKTLKESLNQKLAIADELDGLLSGLYRSENNFPYAKIYDTKSSIKSFIEDTIIKLDKKSIIYTIDNPGQGNYTKIFSEDLFLKLLKIKKDRNIFTKTLIPFGLRKIINQEKINAQNIEIKEMPENIDFKASLWIIDNNLILFSGKYPFVVSINHGIFTESIKSIFSFLWSISK